MSNPARRKMCVLSRWGNVSTWQTGSFRWGQDVETMTEACVCVRKQTKQTKHTWGISALRPVVSLLMLTAVLTEELHLIPKLFDFSIWDSCWVFRFFYRYQFRYVHYYFIQEEEGVRVLLPHHVTLAHHMSSTWTDIWVDFSLRIPSRFPEPPSAEGGLEEV